MKRDQSLVWFQCSVLAAFLNGCMVHRPSREFQPSVRPAEQYYQAAPGQPDPSIAGENWWETFHDEVLNGLMEETLTANLQLQQLAARIEQAEALLSQAGARLFPSLDGTADYESRWRDLDDRRSVAREEALSVGGLFNWELDVWGRLRSAKRARAYESQAAIVDWEGGRLLLSASVAETYFEIIEQRQQLRLLRDQIEINQTLLDLTRLRFGQGQSSIVDVLQQREQLASTRARVPDIESRLEQLEYTLDVLLGRAPGDRERFADSELRPPPPLPATGIPSDLLEGRPDVKAAHHLAVATDYRVGEAIAARLPQFVIGGSLSATGDPGINSLVASAFAGLTGPIFDAGARKAEVSLRQAQLDEVLADFSNTYLSAVQEVETALVHERKQAERVQLLESQLNIAQRLLSETRNRYSQGLTDYLPVLAAVVTVQNLQRELLTSRRELLSFRVALHRSIGGPMQHQEFEALASTNPLSQTPPGNRPAQSGSGRLAKPEPSMRGGL